MAHSGKTMTFATDLVPQEDNIYSLGTDSLKWIIRGSLPLSDITGADDLKAIEAISGTTGLLKKTAANTWTLDTNTYLTAHRTYTAVSGKKPTGNQTPGFGSTFDIEQVGQDTTGQVSVTERTVKIPDTAASTSTAGLVNTSAQSFAGIKTFYDHYTNGHIASTTTTAGQYAVIRCTNKGAWMTSFHVRMYTSYESYTLEISGYNYNTNNWYSPRAIMVASTSTSKVTVTFGYDNDATNNYKTLWVAIPIGNYPGIDVQSVVTGHSDNQPRFSVTIESGIPATVQTTIDTYRPWYRNETVNDATNATNAASATTATTAGAFSSGTTVKLTGDTTGESSSSTKGWSVTATTAKLSYQPRINTLEELNAFHESQKFKIATLAYIEGHEGTLPKNDGIIISVPWSAQYGHQFYVDDNSYQLHHRFLRPVTVNDVSTPTWAPWVQIIDSSNYKSYAWARPSSITTDQVLISSGTNGSTTLRGILNNTSSGALGWNSAGNSNANNLRLIDVNTLAYWNGAYSGTNSNLSVLGTITTGTWHGTKIANDYIANPKVTIAGNDVSLGGSLTAATLTSSLGLSNALHFIGITSTTITDGSTTSTLTAKSTGSLTKTTDFVDGDVIMDGDQLREYVWSGSAWRLLGITTSTAYTQPASTATNTWIAQVSQGTDGKITATTGSLNTSGTWSGTASKATTTANTTDSIYPVGVKSGATTTLLHDTSITMKGNAITAVTYNSTAASLTSETSTTANTAKYATLTLGNNANVNTTTAHSEGQIVIYSAATQAHTIKGASTTTAYTHTLPNNTGLLVSLSSGTAKGSTTKPVYIPNTGIVTECSTYAGGTKVTFNGADKGASTASFYAPTAGGTAGHILIGAGTTTAPAWYGGTVMSGSAAASWKTAFNGTTDATASNAAAVTIAGGLGIAKSIIVGEIATVADDILSPRFTLTVNGTDKAYLQYNTTDDSIDFIFV